MGRRLLVRQVGTTANLEAIGMYVAIQVDWRWGKLAVCTLSSGLFAS